MALIRIKASGQVEDFAPSFAQILISTGRGEYLSTPVVVGKPNVETAALAPAPNAMLGRFEFRRGPITPRKGSL